MCYGQQNIRVGSLVRIKHYPAGLTDLAGLAVIEPGKLLDHVWRVTAVKSSKHAFVSFFGARFKNRAGQDIAGFSFDVDDLDVLGFEPVVLCAHLQPLLAELLTQHDQEIVSYQEAGWPGNGPSVFLKHVPTHDRLTRVQRVTSPMEFWSEEEPKMGNTNGVFCRACEHSIAWPYSKG